MALVRSTNNAVVNDAREPGKYKGKREFFYQKIAQNMGWSHFGAILFKYWTIQVKFIMASWYNYV